MVELEDDEKEFSRLLAEKQHRELLSMFKALNSAISKIQSNDTNINLAISSYSRELSKFADKISSVQPIYKSPDVFINQDQVIAELQKLQSEFKKVSDLLSQKKPVVYEFKVERGYGNVIEKITATPK